MLILKIPSEEKTCKIYFLMLDHDFWARGCEGGWFLIDFSLNQQAKKEEDIRAFQPNLSILASVRQGKTRPCLAQGNLFIYQKQ